jgi:hypothetical protein
MNKHEEERNMHRSCGKILKGTRPFGKSCQAIKLGFSSMIQKQKKV